MIQRLDVKFRPVAADDLDAIYRVIYEASLSPAIACSFVSRIRARCLRIGDAQHGGRLRDDLHPGLRTISFEKTAVIACLVRQNIEITNVFYGGRDYEALYRGAQADE